MARINPRKIQGRWIDGYALDVHTISSVPLGEDEFGHMQFDTKRSEMGELLYKLKYKNESGALAEIIDAAASFVGGWTEAKDVNLLVPVPPSRPRATQPVLQVATALAAKLGIPCDSTVLTKVKETPELKNVFDYDERIKLLADAHKVDTQKLLGKTVLLFDDLFRSGATMNSIAAALIDVGKASKVVALTLTRTRSKQ